MAKTRSNKMLLLCLIFTLTVAGVQSEIGAVGPRSDILEKAIRRVNSASSDIIRHINSFHYYDYDGHPYDIHDGGHGMYDGIGNKVYHTNEVITDVLYDYNLAYGNYVYGVRSVHPLFGLVWIKNRKREYHTYRIQIEGYPGYGASRRVQTSDGVLSLDGAKVQYQIFQVYSLGIPTICELYFVMENENWDSKAASNLTVMTYSKSANYLQNAVYLAGRPSNLLMGYMLLSSSNGTLIPTNEIEEVLRISTMAVIELDMNSRNFTEVALRAVEAEAPSMRAAVTDWYNYTYSMQEIENGGEDMYGRRGNRIDFREDAGNPTHLYYDLTYKGTTCEVTSRTAHPFFGLMWIRNDLEEFHSYSWQVTGYAGRNQIGLITSNSGVLEEESVIIHFQYFSLHNIRNHPSICEVYFTAESTKWNSSSLYTFSSRFGNDSENLDNTVTIEGNPRNILMGYLLLSKKNGTRVTVLEIGNSLTIIAKELEKITVVTDEHLETVAGALETAAPEIVDVISGWHPYFYDEQFYKISYEPNDMYLPWGNMMILAEDLDHASYNRTSYDLFYSYEKSAIQCKTGHPFVSLMLIDDDQFRPYSLKIHSHVDLPGSERYVEYQGTFLALSGTFVDYFVFQLYGRQQPSICEVYFTLRNPTNWSSVSIDSYTGSHFERSNIQDNYIYMLGYVKRMFMGYTLLSRYPGNVSVAEEEVIRALSTIATAVTESLPRTEDMLFCKKETLIFPRDDTIRLTFRETSIDSTAYTTELCPVNTEQGGNPYGSRKCSAEGLWNDPIWITSCDERITETTASSSNELTTSESTTNRGDRRIIYAVVGTLLFLQIR